MEIKINDKITNEITEKINEFYEKNDTLPTKVILGNNQYMSLYYWCFYNWSREFNKPLILTEYMDCKIELGFKEEIIVL